MKDQIEVQKVVSTIIDLPTIRPHQLSMTTMHKQTMVIVEVHFTDGIVGLGEATTIGGLSYGDESPEGIKLTIDTYLAPAILKLDATNINLVVNKMNKVARGNRVAKSAIETALLDAQGKRLNISMSTLLGGSLRNTLPVLWTLASGNTAKDIEEAEKLLEEKRHNIFKLKIGARDPKTDVAHVAAIKKALGDRVKLTVDVNQAWSECTCKMYIPALEDAGVDLIEQPIKKENHLALARLTQSSKVPIMVDEALATLDDAFELARLHAGDVWALKIAKSGGPLSMLGVAKVGEAAGVTFYGGTLLEGTIGTIASAHACTTLNNLEWGTELFGPLLLTDDIITNRIEYRNFEFKIPEGPGLGLELDSDKMKFYRRT